MNTIYIIGKEIRQTWLTTATFLLVFSAMVIFADLISQRLFIMFAVLASGLYVISAILMAERYEERNKPYHQNSVSNAFSLLV